MKLYDYIRRNELLFVTEEIENAVFSGICSDSRKIKQGELFFCMKDSESFLGEAISKGAAGVIFDRFIDARLPIPSAAVLDIHEAFAKASLRAMGEPQKKLRICAVTGTNGKTTVAHMLSCILNAAGYNSSVIGTLGAEFGEELVETGYTTPPSDVLSSLLARAAEKNNDFVILEASSHALSQGRLSGLDFEVGIFTNISRDHLDYHKTVEECAAAKSKLFSRSRISIINFDDRFAYEMAWTAKDMIRYYSAEKSDTDYFAEGISFSQEGLSFDFRTSLSLERIKARFYGMYSVYNILAAMSAASSLGIRQRLAANAVMNMRPIPGRMEKLETETGFKVFIDFAHTPDAIKNALSALRPVTAGKLICVFGCGGDRDSTKRAEMGHTACTLADTVIITSDNPRSEDPEEIIRQIESDIKGKFDYKTVTDRREATALALDTARDGDTVVILGKGHESYIDAGGRKLPYSDKSAVTDILKKKRM